MLAHLAGVLLQLKSMLFIIESTVNKGEGNNTSIVSIYVYIHIYAICPAHD